MATLEELVVTLAAETQGLRAEMKAATKVTADAMNKMSGSLEEMSKNSQKSLSFFEQSMASAVGFLGSQAFIGALGLAKDAASFLFQELVVNGVQASIATQDAVNRMNTALALTGQYSKSTSEAMIELADGIEKTTKFSDDAVLTSAALIQTLAKLDSEGLQVATTAAVDLAAALGIDLESASRLIGKAANGNTEAFKRYGIVIEEGATKTQTFKNTLEALAFTNGAAEKQAKTFSGETTKLTAAWEDLTKVFGNAVIENQVLLNVLSFLRESINGVTDDLSKNSTAYKELIGNGIIVMIDVIGVALTTLDLFVRSLQFVAGVLNAVIAPLHLLAAGIELLTNGADSAKAMLTDWVSTVKKDLSAFGESGNGVLHSMSQSFAALSVSAQDGLAKVKQGSESTIEPMNNTIAKVHELTEAEKKRVDNLTTFAQGLADQTANIETQYGIQQEMLKLNLDAGMMTEEEYHAARMEALTMRQEEELALLEQYRALKGASDETYSKAKLAIEQKTAIENKKIKNDMQKYEELTDKERLANLQSTLGQMAQLSQSGNRTLAAIGKAAAITQATIDGFAAVQKALASAPPPINFALAAAVGVATAANIARISGVALNKGGTVPGMGANTDRVPAMLTPGEEVVNRSTADKLRDFLDQNQVSGTSERVIVELSLKDELVEFIEAKILERQRIGSSLLVGT